MSQYLNKDEVLEAFEWGDADIYKDFGGAYGFSEFGFSRAAIREILDQIPAADVAPVVRGRWVPFHSTAAGDIQYCSACKIGNAAKSDFCPHCGAKMDMEVLPRE